MSLKIFQNATTLISFPDLYHAVGVNTPLSASFFPFGFRHHCLWQLTTCKKNFR